MAEADARSALLESMASLGGPDDPDVGTSNAVSAGRASVGSDAATQLVANGWRRTRQRQQRWAVTFQGAPPVSA